MTTPTTRDFTFKWASTKTIQTSSGTHTTTINYTSTTSIPIWKYGSLQKIVVKTRSIKNSFIDFDINNNFILFDKTRDSNPALTDNNPFNLHDELLKFQKLSDNKIPLYGQPCNDMYYVNGEGMSKPIIDFYIMAMDRTFNVTYTYKYFDCDIPKSIGLPLQFLFNDYIFTTSDVTKYTTMGYTPDDLIKAGLKYSQLLNAGYNIIDDLFPVLFEPSGIAVECIKAINNLKNVNTILNKTNTIAINTNILLKDTNNILTNTNTILSTTNNTLKDTNTILSTTNNTLKDTNTILSTENNRIRIMPFPPGPYYPIPSLMVTTPSYGPTGPTDLTDSTDFTDLIALAAAAAGAGVGAPAAAGLTDSTDSTGPSAPSAAANPI